MAATVVPTLTEQVAHARELYETVEDRVSRLRVRRHNLLAEIGEAADAARSGKNNGADFAQLANEKAALDREIEAEETLLQMASRDLKEAIREEQQIRLEMLIHETQKERQRFASLYRESCIALGNICRRAEAAGTLANELGIPLRGNLDRQRVIEIGTCPDPLPKLLDELRPGTSLGFDWSARIVPLHNKFDQQEAVCKTNNSR